MKVMITGIAGFIGMHTAIRFKELGWEVSGFDNFNDIVYDQQIKRDRAANLADHYQITVAEHDLSSDWQMDMVMESTRPDLVIHLAAHAGVRVSMDQPREYIDNNVTGTQNLINACEKAGVKNVIYASTSCTMEGNPLPWGPDENLGKQLSPYGWTKQTNENQFHTSNIPNAVCLRFFTVYGPWGRPDMALYSFTNNIINDKPITVYNNGDMKRDFTYVDDIVQGIEIIASNMTERETYCIGFGQQVDLMDFINHIESNLGKTATKEFAPRHPADALETWSDTTKLQELGYNPSTPVGDGVRNFVEWYKNYYIHNNQIRKVL